MKKKFGDRLKAIRTERNMSQEELAELLGTSKQVLSRYETNQRTPKITVVSEYAQKLEVSLNYLLGETEQKNPPPAEAGGTERQAIDSYLDKLNPEGLQRAYEILRVALPIDEDTNEE